MLFAGLHLLDDSCWARTIFNCARAAYKNLWCRSECKKQQSMDLWHVASSLQFKKKLQNKLLLLHCSVQAQTMNIAC